jgi:hypothetical protein
MESDPNRIEKLIGWTKEAFVSPIREYNLPIKNRRTNVTRVVMPLNTLRNDNSEASEVNV